jgi:hypothetical protein
MPRRRNYNSRKKNRNKNSRYQPRQKVRFQRKNAKYQLANKVELVRPITLKPTSVMKKFVFYNTAEVKNALNGGAQQCQFVQMFLNSPWLLASSVYAEANGSQWKWNKTMTTHVDDALLESGTAFPGLFEYASSVGRSYQNLTVVGSKVTITATPIIDANVGPKCVTALFANVDSQGSNLTDTSTIDDLYQMPYTQIRKVTGGQSNNGDMSGNTKSASIVLKYSPKRFNNIKDIRDNSSFHALLNIGAGTGRLPPERDRVCFGVVPVASNPISAKECVKVLLQYKHECTILFSEPFNNNNIGVAVPAALEDEV